MSFLERDGFDPKKMGHPFELLKLIERVEPFLLAERQNHQPLINPLIEDEEWGLSVDPEAIRAYLKLLRVAKRLNGGTKTVSVHNKIDHVEFWVGGRHLEEDEHLLGLNSGPEFLARIQQIEVIIPERHFPFNSARYLEEEFGMTNAIDRLELSWVVGFWMNFNPSSPTDNEIALNMTALHEIHHCRGRLQRLINLVLALRKAEEVHKISRRPKNEALELVRSTYGQERFPFIWEPEADAFMVRMIGAIYQAHIYPKIITIDDPKKFFTHPRSDSP